MLRHLTRGSQKPAVPAPLDPASYPLGSTKLFLKERRLGLSALNAIFTGGTGLDVTTARSEVASLCSRPPRVICGSAAAGFGDVDGEYGLVDMAAGGPRSRSHHPRRLRETGSAVRAQDGQRCGSSPPGQAGFPRAPKAISGSVFSWNLSPPPQKDLKGRT